MTINDFSIIDIRYRIFTRWKAHLYIYNAKCISYGHYSPLTIQPIEK